MSKHPINAPERFQDAPKRRRRPRTGLSKVLLPALVFFVMLFGALAVTEAPVTLPSWVTKPIEARVNRGAGQELVRLGETEFQILDGLPRVTMRNLALNDPTGASLGQLNAVRARFDTQALLSGQVVPTYLRVAGAQITIRRTLNGEFALSLGGSGSAQGDFVTVVNAVADVFEAAPLDQVELIEAEDLTITLEDARSGLLWQATDGGLRLENTDEAVSITVVSDVFNGTENLAPVQISFRADKQNDGVGLGVTMRELAAQDIAAQAPTLGMLGVLDAPISGALRAEVSGEGGITTMAGSLEIGAGALRTGEGTTPIDFSSARAFFEFDGDRQKFTFSELSVETDLASGSAAGHAYLTDFREGWPAALVAQLDFGELRFAPENMLPLPLELDGAHADLRVQTNPFEISLGQLLVRDDDKQYKVTGSAKPGPEGWRAAMDVSIPEMWRDRLFELWPTVLVPETRKFLEEAIHEARFQDVMISVRSEGEKRPNLGLSFRYDETEMTVLPEFPVVENGSGLATILNDQFTIEIETGTLDPGAGGVIDFGGTTVQLPDIQIDPTPVKVRLKTEGTLEATLTTMDNKPFEILSKSGRSAQIADGTARTDGVIELVLDTPVQLEDVSYQIGGSIDQVTSDVLVADRRVEAPKLVADITPDGLTLGGPGTIDGLPFNILWSQPFGDAADAGSRLTGAVELSQRFLDTFGIGLPPGTVSGSGRADIDIALPEEGAPELTLTSDLEDVAIDFAPVAWNKPTGVTGDLKVTGTLGTPVDIGEITIDAPGLNATGTVELDAAGEFEAARFNEVTVDDWLAADVVLTGRGEGANPDITVTAGRLDIRSLPEFDEPSGDTTNLDLALDELVISETIALRPFRADTRSGAGLSGSFTGRVNGGAPVRGSLIPTADGTAFRIIGDDAGEILKSAGVFEQMEAGSFEMVLRPFKDAEGYDGQLEIGRARLRDQPSIAALLDAISVVGILDQLEGPGILFDTIDARFRITPDRVIVDQGAAVGGSLGLSLDGIYNLETDALDMQGVISPIYLLNGIGQIFTRRGEGLFGFSFRMTGKAEDPRISVNPLSILTPGMFREIFRRAPPGQRNQQQRQQDLQRQRQQEQLSQQDDN